MWRADQKTQKIDHWFMDDPIQLSTVYFHRELFVQSYIHSLRKHFDLLAHLLNKSAIKNLDIEIPLIHLYINAQNTNSSIQ